jgi:hypothetical protein
MRQQKLIKGNNKTLHKKSGQVGKLSNNKEKTLAQKTGQQVVKPHRFLNTPRDNQKKELRPTHNKVSVQRGGRRT